MALTSSRAVLPCIRARSALSKPIRPIFTVQQVQRLNMSVTASKQVVSTTEAPAALGPYSQVITLKQVPSSSYVFTA